MDENVEVGRKGVGMKELRGVEGKGVGDVVVFVILMPVASEVKARYQEVPVFSSFELLRQIGEVEPNVPAERISAAKEHKHPLSATGELNLEGSEDRIRD